MMICKDEAILVTAYAMSLYLSIPHEDGLETLRKRLNELAASEIPTEDILQIAEYVLKNMFFEFDGEVKQQKLGTVIGTKFKPPFACIFMDEVETEFFKSEELQLFLWLRYINVIFFIWAHGKQKLDLFHNELYNFHPNLSFTCETSTEIANFIDLNVRIKNGAIITDLYVKPVDGH